jgi:tetratricopeptide (TPR) repeat protein
MGAERHPGSHNQQRGQAGTPVDRVASAGQLMKEARQAFYREDDQEALDLFEEVIRLAPQNLHAHYLGALCADLVTNEEAVDRIVAHAQSIDRRHPYAIACEAVRFLFLSNFSRADDLFGRALESLPDDVDLYIGVGILHEYSGEEGRSQEAFERALECDPRNVRARVSLGLAYAMSGEYQNALAEYRKAKEIDPDLDNPHLLLGRDYFLEGSLGEAASEFAQATNEEPEAPAAWFYLMDCYNRLGRCDDALDMYETIKERFDSDPEQTSGFYEFFNMHREAAAAFDRLVEKYPDDAELRYRQAKVLQAAGRLDDAIYAARAGSAIDPDDFHLWDTLGALLFEKGEYQDAIDACRRAIELNPYAQSAYVTTADSLLFLGRDAESKAVVEEMEKNREEAYRRYRDKFSGGDGAPETKPD